MEREQSKCGSFSGCKKLNDIEQNEFAFSKLTEEQRRIIEDYIACILTTQYRVAALSYVAGGRDTYRMLKELDLLK